MWWCDVFEGEVFFVWSVQIRRDGDGNLYNYGLALLVNSHTVEGTR